MKELVPSVMKLLMKKVTVLIHFSGCGKQKKRDFSATKVAAAVFGKFFFINKNISKNLYKNTNKIEKIFLNFT